MTHRPSARRLWQLGGPQADTTLEGEEARTEAVAQAGWPAQGATADWIALAVTQIRKELGEDVTSFTPVELSLRTALGVLGSEAKLDRGLSAAMEGAGE